MPRPLPFLLLILLLLTGCRTLPGPTFSDATVPPSPTASPTSETPAAETATPAPAGTEPPNPLLLTPVQDAAQPLHFTFPTQRPEPVSAWRPPLYPVPWAANPQDHFYFTRPIPVDKVNWPLADYRYGGNFFEDVIHTGIDIPGPAGTPVLAAGDGRVVWVGYGLLTGTPGNLDDAYGLAIAILHDFGYQGEELYTVYAHLSQADVVDEQVVKSGQQIGLTGITGITTGPHLHFEVRLGRNDYFSTRNPELWIAPPQGWGVIAGRLTGDDGELLDQYEVLVISRLDLSRNIVMTYGERSINNDAYYEENLVMSNLPAGNYLVEINYAEQRFSQVIEVKPGVVSYFRFRGSEGFSLDLPPTPVPQIPAPLSP